MAELNVKNIFGRIKSTPEELKNMVLRKSPDRKILLYFSMGYLVEMYMGQAEQMMKERGGREASYFTGKATTIKEITERIFGQVPEKDYYKGIYEVPEKWNPQTDPEEIDELAKFAVSNMPQIPQVRDADKLRELIKEKLRTYERKGIVVDFIKEIKKSADEWESPGKLSLLLEITFLLENINRVLEAIEEEADTEEENEGDEEETEELYPGIKKGEEELEGFKVEE